jgi:hypothetical protein
MSLRPRHLGKTPGQTNELLRFSAWPFAEFRSRLALAAAAPKFDGTAGHRRMRA